MSQKQRTQRIRQQLEAMKAELARQDRELQEAAEEAGVDEASLAAAAEEHAELLAEVEPLQVAPQKRVVLPPMAIRV